MRTLRLPSPRVPNPVSAVRDILGWLGNAEGRRSRRVSVSPDGSRAYIEVRGADQAGARRRSCATSRSRSSASRASTGPKSTRCWDERSSFSIPTRSRSTDLVDAAADRRGGSRRGRRALSPRPSRSSGRPRTDPTSRLRDRGRRRRPRRRDRHASAADRAHPGRDPGPDRDRRQPAACAALSRESARSAGDRRHVGDGQRAVASARPRTARSRRRHGPPRRCRRRTAGAPEVWERREPGIVQGRHSVHRRAAARAAAAGTASARADRAVLGSRRVGLARRVHGRPRRHPRPASLFGSAAGRHSESGDARPRSVRRAT